MKVQKQNITVNVVVGKRAPIEAAPMAPKPHRVPRVKLLVSIPAELLGALDALATARYSSRSLELSRGLLLLLEQEERAASTSEREDRP